MILILEVLPKKCSAVGAEAAVAAAAAVGA